MFTDAVDGIVEFTVTGDDSEFMPTVCVAFVEGVVAGEEAIVGDPTVDVFGTCVIVGIVDVDWKALMFTDAVDGIVEFAVAGDDSEFMPTVCVAFVEGVVDGEEAIVGDPTVDVFVTCATVGIVDVDWKALMFTDAVDGIVEFTVTDDDSEFLVSVCVVIAKDVVTCEEATVENPIVDVFVICVIDGIGDVD